MPTISALAADDSLSIWFGMAACSAAKFLPEPQRGNVLAGVAGGSSHFSLQTTRLEWLCQSGDFQNG
jgi:hypothetical protein